MSVSAVDASPATLKALADIFNQTLEADPGTRGRATTQLLNFEQKPGHTLILLTLIANGEVPLPTRQAAAISFKNFILKYWDEDLDATAPGVPPKRLGENDRRLIKQHIVNLMLSSPIAIQSQLSQALTIISKSDFPHNWPTLLPELVQHLQSSNASSSNDQPTLQGILETFHAIFAHYRYEMRSDALYTEIIIVLEKLVTPLTELQIKTYAAVKNPANSNSLRHFLRTLLLEYEVFYSLIWQEISDDVVKALDDWLNPMLSFLQYKNPLLDSKDEEEAGPVEQVQTLICEITTLFAHKYSEDFQKYLQSFVTNTWSLLTTLDTKARYDSLVTTAIKFLTAIVERSDGAALFASTDALKSIAEKILIPQLMLRDSDVELFSDNYTEYIRRDIEGSDIDTRRRTTVDFIRGLCVHFEVQLTDLLKNYISNLLQSYHSNANDNWRNKDAAIYMILALSAKASTSAKGVTQVSQYIDVTSVISTEIITELQIPAATHKYPILQADCLHFLIAFRTQLPVSTYPSLFPLIINCLTSNEYVVYSYAAHAIEKLLLVRDTDKDGRQVVRVTKELLQPYLNSLLVNLFGLLKKKESSENPYIMKSILMTVVVAQVAVTQYVSTLITTLTEILNEISKNPKNPLFTHYLFETFAALITTTCKGAETQRYVENYETVLFPQFQDILGKESCIEFHPYCFQLLALLLEKRTSLTPSYNAIFPSLLAPVLWEQHGNIIPLVRLFSAYLRLPDSSEILLTGTRLEGVLGIFQKLLSTKRDKALALDLVSALVTLIPFAKLTQYLPEILRLLFTQLMTKPGGIFNAGCIVFFSSFIHKHGFGNLLSAMDSIQPNIFVMILDKVWLPNITFVKKPSDKIITIKGMTDMITNPILLSPVYTPYYARSLTALFQLFPSITITTNAKSATTNELLEEGEIEEDRAFSTGYYKLIYAPSIHVSEASVNNSKEYVITALKKLLADNNVNNQVISLIKQGLSQEIVAFWRENGVNGNIPNRHCTVR